MGGGGTYLGWGSGAYLGWGEGVPTLNGGGAAVTYLGWGEGYLPWMVGRGYQPWMGGGGTYLGGRLCCGRYASCGFPQEDFLLDLLLFFNFFDQGRSKMIFAESTHFCILDHVSYSTCNRTFPPFASSMTSVSRREVSYSYRIL